MKNITRKKHGKSFSYYIGDEKLVDKAEVARIKSLAIPPAWQDVQIAGSPSAKIQATGVDKAGRTQAIYSATFRAKQEKAKFERIMRFAEQLPGLRRQIEKDLKQPGLTKDKVLACTVKLMDEAYFRVGNENYAKDNETYGITTMRRKHATITSTHVVFDFVGKSGQHHVKKINDRQIANILKQLDELPGYEILKYVDNGKVHDVKSADVNDYIKRNMGDEFTAKDFRTWGGTLLAAAELAVSEHAGSERERKKAVTVCVKKVAKRLGNTPAVARSSYIDTRVIETYMKSEGLADFADAITNMNPPKYRKPEEVCTLDLLKNYA